MCDRYTFTSVLSNYDVYNSRWFLFYNDKVLDLRNHVKVNDFLPLNQMIIYGATYMYIVMFLIRNS